MKLEKADYLTFYNVLYDKLIEKVYKNEFDKGRTERSQEAWRNLPKDKFISLFGDAVTDSYYFYKRWSDTNDSNIKKIKINPIAFANALKFIGIEVPEKFQTLSHLPISQKVELLHKEFKKKYPTILNDTNSNKNIKRINSLEENNHITTNKSSNSNFDLIRNKLESAQLETSELFTEERMFWCFSYNFDGFNYMEDIEKEFWFLQKSLLIFKEDQKGNIKIFYLKDLTSTDIYVGNIDSKLINKASLSINLTSSSKLNGSSSLTFVFDNFAYLLEESPYLIRDLSPGIYIKFSNENILSVNLFDNKFDLLTGFIVLQRIPKELKESELVPKGYSIPNKPPFKSKIEGIITPIIDYLYYSNKNIAQIPYSDYATRLKIIHAYRPDYDSPIPHISKFHHL